MTGCSSHCCLNIEFELHHECLTYLNNVLDLLTHVRFTELELLDIEGHERNSAETLKVKRTTAKTERRIREIT